MGVAEVPLIQLLDRETGLMTKHTMHTHTNTHTHHAHTNTHTHTHTEGEGALLSVSLSPAGVHGWLSIVHSPAWSPTVGVVRAENQEVDKAVHCLGGLEVSLTFASNHHRELVLQQVQWGGGGAGQGGAGFKVLYVLSYRHVLVGGPPGGRSGVGTSVCGGTSASAGCR